MLQRAFQLNPDSVSTFKEYCHNYAEDGRWIDARQTCRQAVEISPNDAELLNVAGVSAFKLNDTSSAEKLFLQVLQVDPGHAGAYKNLCVIYGQTGRAPEALAYCRRAMQIDGQCVDCLGNMSRAFELQNNLPEAIKNLYLAEKLAPNHGGIHRALARLLFQADQTEEAQRHYQRALQLGINDPELDRMFE